MFRVELLNIGTELLLGNVLNRHAAYLGRKLTTLGATLTRQICVNDTAEDIQSALKDAITRADLVITTGGLGPTSDDITRDLVVQLFGLKTRLDERALANIEERFRRRGNSMPESNKSQAYVPEIAMVLYNQNGTAPGLMIPLKGRVEHPGSTADDSRESSPQKPVCKWIVMLPGPPRELHPMFEEQVYPWIKTEFRSQLPMIECRVLKTVGIGESVAAEKVEAILKDFSKNLEIGYCAHSNQVDVRLFIRGTNLKEIQKIANEAEAKTRSILSDSIFGSGDDITLEEVVVKLLQKQRASVTTAESCTGGFLSHRITMVSGSSEVFRKGFVVYSNDAKANLLGVPGHLIVEHGAVSEPVAHAMAENALKKAEADYALAITGIAGPTGGTDEKPVGTVYIALATKSEVQVQHQVYRYDRETFKFVTTQTALNMLRKKILKL
jgi:nicotinamide-nucleotide amidase